MVVIAVFVCTVIPYALTVDPGVDWGDYGDFQVVPYILGIAYPTGFPGYTLFGWLWSHAIPFGSVALRMNELSVLAAASTNAVLAALLLELDVSPLTATISGVLFGLCYQEWSHAGAASAHEIGTFLLVACLYWMTKWVGRTSPTALRWSILAYSIALACDSTTIIALPGLITIGSARRPSFRSLLTPIAVGTVLICLAYAYLPLRSAYVSSHGLDPTRVAGLSGDHQFWDQGHPSTYQNFVAVVSGEGFRAPGGFGRMLEPREILRSWNTGTGQVTSAFGPLGLVYSLIGIAVFFRSRFRLFFGIALISGLTLLFVTAWHGEFDATRYAPRELLAVLIAGAWFAEHIIRSKPRVATAGKIAVVLVLASTIVVEQRMVGQVLADGRTRDARAVARVVSNAPPGSIVVAPWYEAAPLAYLAYVDGIPANATVACCDVALLEPAIVGRTAKVPLLAVFPLGTPPTSKRFSSRSLAQYGDLGLWALSPHRN